jgi:hypothetical protein
LVLPPGDVLIHSGDWSQRGQSRSKLEDFAAWLEEQDFALKLLVPGNHEVGLEEMGVETTSKSLGWTPRIGCTDLLNVTNGGSQQTFLLNNAAVQFRGVIFYGASCMPRREAFYKAQAFATDPEEMGAALANAPECDVLVTHSPPHGVLDKWREHHGSKVLRNYLPLLNPSAHFFGHVHSQRGWSKLHHQQHGGDSGAVKDAGVTLCVNAASVENLGRSAEDAVYPPVLVQLGGSGGARL